MTGSSPERPTVSGSRAAPGQPFSRVLDVAVHGLAAGPGRLFAATDAGVFESRDGGTSWARVGAFKGRVDAVLWSRAPGSRVEALAVRSAGRTLWWNGRDFGLEALRGSSRPLTGGFGRPRASAYRPPEPIGVEIEAEQGAAPLPDGGRRSRRAPRAP